MKKRSATTMLIGFARVMYVYGREEVYTQRARAVEAEHQSHRRRDVLYIYHFLSEMKVSELFECWCLYEGSEQLELL